MNEMRNIERFITNNFTFPYNVSKIEPRYSARVEDCRIFLYFFIRVLYINGRVNISIILEEIDVNMLIYYKLIFFNV